MEIVGIEMCNVYPSAIMHRVSRGVDFEVMILGMGEDGIAHYDAVQWIQALNIHPVGPLVNSLPPEHSYLVSFEDDTCRVFSNALGLAHIYRCHLLLNALEEVALPDLVIPDEAAPGG